MASSKQTGKDFESRVCANLQKWGLDARQVPFSGAGKDEKGDVQVTIEDVPFLLECKKTRGKKTWTLERYMLDKIHDQATAEDRQPLLVFGMQYSPLYCILKLEDLIKLLQRSE